MNNQKDSMHYDNKYDTLSIIRMNVLFGLVGGETMGTCILSF